MHAGKAVGMLLVTLQKWYMKGVWWGVQKWEGNSSNCGHNSAKKGRPGLTCLSLHLRIPSRPELPDIWRDRHTGTPYGISWDEPPGMNHPTCPGPKAVLEVLSFTFSICVTRRTRVWFLSLSTYLKVHTHSLVNAGTPLDSGNGSPHQVCIHTYTQIPCLDFLQEMNSF